VHPGLQTIEKSKPKHIHQIIQAHCAVFGNLDYNIHVCCAVRDCQEINFFHLDNDSNNLIKVNKNKNKIFVFDAADDSNIAE
jgi:hypothetical protein